MRLLISANKISIYFLRIPLKSTCNLMQDRKASGTYNEQT